MASPESWMIASSRGESQLRNLAQPRWRAGLRLNRRNYFDHSSFKRTQQLERAMLYWALVFFIVAIIAAFLGFGGIAGAAAGIAKILFFIFLVLLVVSLLFGWRRGRGPI
jgi:uncharacterized membrane protein YtjA (UPF0391 family)